MTQSISARDVTRRDALKLATAAVTLPLARLQARRPKRVIVAGGGIGGLCCGYELMKRGHDVVVLEASDRTGGHVFTVRDVANFQRDQVARAQLAVDAQVEKRQFASGAPAAAGCASPRCPWA